MIGCENGKMCPYGVWFHPPCLGIYFTAYNEWVCPQCKEDKKNKKNKKKSGGSDQECRVSGDQESGILGESDEECSVDY